MYIDMDVGIARGTLTIFVGYKHCHKDIIKRPHGPRAAADYHKRERNR